MIRRMYFAEIRETSPKHANSKNRPFWEFLQFYSSSIVNLHFITGPQENFCGVFRAEDADKFVASEFPDNF